MIRPQSLSVIVGCPRHDEGHHVIRMPLPQRVDDVLRHVGRLRCPTPVRSLDKEPVTCGHALMFLRVEP